MAMRLVPTDSVPDQPWANGGGTTRELLAWAAPGAPGWQLRVSVATIARDGPFSMLAGVQRWFAVLEGAGVRLAWGARIVPVLPGAAPIAFDGAQPPDCTLIDGATRDLNLMVRHGSGTMVAVLPGAPHELQGDQGGLYAVAGGTLIDAAGRRLRVPEHALAWSEDARRSRWRFEAAGAPARQRPAYWLEYSAA